MKTLKIKDEEELIRDTNTQAVLNSNMSSLEKYKARRDKDREMNDDVQSLKQDMKEIKELLQQLIK
jgi:chromosome segregation ATPase